MLVAWPDACWWCDRDLKADGGGGRGGAVAAIAASGAGKPVVEGEESGDALVRAYGSAGGYCAGCVCRYEGFGCVEDGAGSGSVVPVLAGSFGVFVPCGLPFPLLLHQRNILTSGRFLPPLSFSPTPCRTGLNGIQETRTTQPSSWGSMYYFPEVLISRIVSLVSVLLAAMLLLGAIVGLYFVQHQGARLGMIAAFTTMFAGSIGLLTSARRAEVYAATAAWVFKRVCVKGLMLTVVGGDSYAAVLVVFIGANIGGNNQVQLVKVVS